jgi:putative hydrolase of the HAD superfamily
MLRVVLFDIGGVPEITPLTGWFPRWADELGMDGAELWRRLEDVSRAGSIGTITEADYAAAVESRLGLTPDGRDRFLADLWEEYLGTPN